MKLLADSSAYAKRYVKEYGSDKMDHFLGNATQLGVSSILLPEIVSALNRRKRENKLSADEYQMIKNQVITDIHDVIILQLSQDVIAKTITLLEENTLRAMDALHIGCAVEWEADLFVTADKKQFKAAQNAGLLTEYIG